MSAETFRSLDLVSGRMLCYVILYILSLSTAGGGWGYIIEVVGTVDVWEDGKKYIV